MSDKLPAHERFARCVCAARLDPSTSPQAFAHMLERYEGAVRRDERERLEAASKAEQGDE